MDIRSPQGKEAVARAVQVVEQILDRATLLWGRPSRRMRDKE